MDMKNIKIATGSAQVAEAARRLARLPRRLKRRWSGWIGPIRSYRGMVVRLPSGREVCALGARRGQVPFTSQPDGLLGALDGLGRDWGVVPAHLVEIVKNPAAVLLGAQKAGKRERPSVAKVNAARLNGLVPCRPGRRRGRPNAT
jgi:hypothetical protein